MSYRIALSKFLCCGHLNSEVATLRLATILYQLLQNLQSQQIKPCSVQITALIFFLKFHVVFQGIPTHTTYNLREILKNWNCTKE